MDTIQNLESLFLLLTTFLRFCSAGYFVRARSGGESGDRDTKVIKALSPIFQEAYVQSLERRTCRLQPKFFGELAQVRPSRSLLCLTFWRKFR